MKPCARCGNRTVVPDDSGRWICEECRLPEEIEVTIEADDGPLREALDRLADAIGKTPAQLRIYGETLRIVEHRCWIRTHPFAVRQELLSKLRWGKR